MPTEIYVLHPGVGRGPDSDPAVLTPRDGDEFTWLEQIYPNGVTRRLRFQGVVVPPSLDAGEDATIRLVFRQVDPQGVSDIYVDALYRLIGDGDDRDADPLESLSAPSAGTALTLTGVAGEEKAIEFTVAQAGMTSGDELLLGVARLGGHVNDTYSGNAALVRIDVEFKQTDVPEPEWTDGGGHIYPADGAGKDVSVGTTSAPAAGTKMRVEGGHLKVGDGLWDGEHFIMGSAPNDWHFWIDTTVGTGVLRMKKGAPADETDGQIVGTQSP